MSVAVEYLQEVRREAGVEGVAHSWSYGRGPMTLAEDLFGEGVEAGSYLIEYEVRFHGVPVGTPYWFERYMVALDVAVLDVLPTVTWAWYRRYGGRLFLVVHQRHVDHVMESVGQLLDWLGLRWRRRRMTRLGRSRVVVLGFSVDPVSGSVGLPRRTRRRLRALEHAEGKGLLPRHLRQVLQGLRALERTVSWRAIERAWEKWVPARARAET